MAYIRQLPQPKTPGRPRLWAATVRLPDGSRPTETHRLKSFVKAWAEDLEADVRRGDWIDPKAGHKTVADVWNLCVASRRVELSTRRREASNWRCHVQPRWGSVQIGSILKTHVTAWVLEMERAKTGAATIESTVQLLRTILDTAVEERWLRVNPAYRVSVPERPAHQDRVLAPEEDELLLAACDRQFPDWPDFTIFTELGLYCGVRWEEGAAIDRDHVDLRDRLINIGPVMERDGNIRPYPKSPAGVRSVPVPDHIWPRFRDHVLTRKPGELVILTPRGKPLNYNNWLRCWNRMLKGTPERPRVKGHKHRPPVPGAGLEGIPPTYHDLRHTFCTRLAEQRLPLHELIALTGHESLNTAMRYLHAAMERFERARNAVESSRGKSLTGRSRVPRREVEDAENPAG